MSGRVYTQATSPRLRAAANGTMGRANSKFQNVAGFGDEIRGHILLQDHHSQV
jgi:hypothetical protein